MNEQQRRYSRARRATLISAAVPVLYSAFVTGGIAAWRVRKDNPPKA